MAESDAFCQEGGLRPELMPYPFVRLQRSSLDSIGAMEYEIFVKENHLTFQ